MRGSTTRRRLLASLGSAVAVAGCLDRGDGEVGPDERNAARYRPGSHWGSSACGPETARANPETSLPGTLRPGWKATVERAPRSLVTDERRVFTKTSAGAVHAIEGRDGTEAWTWSPPADDLDLLSLAYLDGLVYVGWRPHGVDRGSAAALDGASGEVVWTIEYPGRLRPGGDPVLCDGDAYLPVSGIGDGGAILRFDPTSGEVASELRVDRSIRYFAVGTDSLLVETRIEPGVERLVALDPVDGTTKWCREFESRLRAPVVGDGLVYATAYRGRLYALDPEDGTTRWTFPRDSGLSIQTAPALAGGRLYAAGWHGDDPGDDEALYAVSADDGTVDWAVELDGPFDMIPVGRTVYVSGSPSPIVAGDTLVVPSTGTPPTLLLFDAADGAKLSELRVPWLNDEASGLAAPTFGLSIAAAHDLLYVAVAADDRVYAYGAPP